MDSFYGNLSAILNRFVTPPPPPHPRQTHSMDLPEVSSWEVSGAVEGQQRFAEHTPPRSSLWSSPPAQGSPVSRMPSFHLINLFFLLFSVGDPIRIRIRYSQERIRLWILPS
jgi:hypothetical protein